MDTNVEPMTSPAHGTIGTWLRERREASGLSLRHIADATKLSVRTLDLLERDRVSQLPGGIYCRAIVRAYAMEVGLDPEQTLQRFLAEHPPDPATLPHAVLPAIRRTSSGHRTRLGVLGALIPVAAGLFYFTISARGSDTPSRILDLGFPYAGVSRTVNMAAASVAVSQPISLMISVSSNCRLQIVADGREVLARDVDAGELLRLELGADVVLLGNDAGAVHFSINGRAGRTLGDQGSALGVRITRDDYESWLIQS